MLSEMLFMKAQAEPLQSLGLCGCTFVRATYYVSQLNEKPGKTAHTASRNTDEVNPMLFGGQKSRQVWQWITTPKFFALRIGAHASCCSRSGFSTSSRMLRASNSPERSACFRRIAASA